MNKLKIYQIDAFTGRLFGGNPAAVVPLEKWLDAATMQSIALENNLAETAFFVPEGDGFRLRWFTPEVEVKLCGHATLASAYVLFTILEPGRRAVKFETLSGTLTVVASGDELVMDFPRWTLSAAPAETSGACSPRRCARRRHACFRPATATTGSACSPARPTCARSRRTSARCASLG